MIEDFLGEATWPIAVIVCVVVIVGGWSVHEDRSNRHELRRQIVAECADKGDVQACADRLVAATKAVK